MFYVFLMLVDQQYFHPLFTHPHYVQIFLDCAWRDLCGLVIKRKPHKEDSQKKFPFPSDSFFFFSLNSLKFSLILFYPTEACGVVIFFFI